MGLIRKVLGPHSKYDKSLPYTYMAKVAVIPGEDDEFSYFYADTICGLVEYLDERDIGPEEVELFGIYQKQEIPIETVHLISGSNKWLKRPDICRSLEKTYQETREERYKGHVEKDECAFDDRDRKGRGSSPAE
jgi:hypothetical protein